MRVLLGARGNLLDETEEIAHLVRLNSPILRNEELKAIQSLDDSAFQSVVLDATFSVADGETRAGEGTAPPVR